MAFLLLVPAFLWLAVSSPLSGPAPGPDPRALVTLSIVGTSDLHGAALPGNGLGVLPWLAGYVNNLRIARAADGGAVLLIDSGDTFQGGIESDLSEGALVVDAYNAMGYTAEAIGNHDFDFGSIDSPGARQRGGDPRGALKARAAQARYPFLAANLIDDATGRPVEWPNVEPSVLVNAAGITVGIVGVMTIDALRSTIAANIRGLHVAPLAPTIVAEATKLRAAGAAVVVVAAHAGGRCKRFDRPSDLSSCDMESEIFEVARNIPRGLVDVIAAGHTHGAVAHQANGIGIVQPFSHGQAFGRIDVVFDRLAGRVARIRQFAPIQVCAEQDHSTGNCVPGATPAAPAQYEGRHVTFDRAIVQAMAPALERVRRLQATMIGGSLSGPLRRAGDLGSPLGNVFADALRAAVPAADVAVVNNATRGLRADLPAGPISLGRLYDVFPFDNRIARVGLDGGDLRRWLAREIQLNLRGGLGISGVSVHATCLPDGIHVELLRAEGPPIQDADRLQVVTIGYPTPSGGVASAAPAGGGSTGTVPVVREAVEDWLRRQARPMRGSLEHADRRLELAGGQTAACIDPH